MGREELPAWHQSQMSYGTIPTLPLGKGTLLVSPVELNYVPWLKLDDIPQILPLKSPSTVGAFSIFFILLTKKSKLWMLTCPQTYCCVPRYYYCIKGKIFIAQNHISYQYAIIFLNIFKCSNNIYIYIRVLNFSMYFQLYLHLGSNYFKIISQIGCSH